MTHAARSLPGERGSLPHFAGRHAEMARLQGQLARLVAADSGAVEEGITLITGVPGVGKSELGRRFAAALPHDTLHCSVSTADLRHTAELFRAFARELGKTETALKLLGQDTKRTGLKVGVAGMHGEVAHDHARMARPALNQLLSDSKAAGMWGAKTLVVLIDEIQNVTAEDAENLRVLHEGRHGCPIMVVGMGLQHAKEVLGSIGISRVQTPIELDCLGDDEAAEAIRENLLAFGFDSVPDQCVERLAEASHGFPQHIHCYLAAVVEALGDESRLGEGNALAKVLEAGDKKREDYYQSRLAMMRLPSPQLPMFTVLAALGERGKLLQQDAEDLFQDTRYDGKDIIGEAIAHGVLRRRDGYVDFDIPSFQGYMEGKRAEHERDVASN